MMTRKDKLETVLVSGTLALLLFALLMALSWLVAVNAAEPITAKAYVLRHDMAVAIRLEPHYDNTHVQVATTALDGVPDSWASDTVYHQWLVHRSTESFIDEWPHMTPGRYRVAVTLIRSQNQTFTVPSQDVLVPQD